MYFSQKTEIDSCVYNKRNFVVHFGLLCLTPCVNRYTESCVKLFYVDNLGYLFDNYNYSNLVQVQNGDSLVICR